MAQHGLGALLDHPAELISADVGLLNLHKDRSVLSSFEGSSWCGFQQAPGATQCRGYRERRRSLNSTSWWGCQQVQSASHHGRSRLWIKQPGALIWKAQQMIAMSEKYF